MGALRTVVVEDERLARRKLVMKLSALFGPVWNMLVKRFPQAEVGVPPKSFRVPGM